jgi:hypothetical protein
MGTERDDTPELDSAGVYFVSVDDFEWRAPKDSEAHEAENDGEESAPEEPLHPGRRLRRT